MLKTPKEKGKFPTENSVLSIHILIVYSNSAYNMAILFDFYIQIYTVLVIIVPGTYLV